jgi:hypothetical protein
MASLSSHCSSAPRLHTGRFYRLLERVGPIPAGIYRCEGTGQNEALFSVGEDRSIKFSIENIDSTHISQVQFRLGKLRATHQRDFIDAYFSALPLPENTAVHLARAEAPRLKSCTIRFGYCDA